MSCNLGGAISRVWSRPSWYGPWGISSKVHCAVSSSEPWDMSSSLDNELAFDRMINSFSSRYLMLGDFNGHSHLWGDNQENERGKIVEKLIDRHNLILLNDSYSV